MKFSHPYKTKSANISIPAKYFNHSEFYPNNVFGFVIVNITTSFKLHNILLQAMDHILFEILNITVLFMRPIQLLLLTNQNHFDLIADRQQNALFYTFSQTQKKRKYQGLSDTSLWKHGLLRFMSLVFADKIHGIVFIHSII